MRQRSIHPSSLAIACPCRCGQMTLRSTGPSGPDSSMEDRVYACQSCEAELIRTVDKSAPLHAAA
jgi:predicted SprT family Zn-dependent metalloprotease